MAEIWGSPNNRKRTTVSPNVTGATLSRILRFTAELETKYPSIEQFFSFGTYSYTLITHWESFHHELGLDFTFFVQHLTQQSTRFDKDSSKIWTDSSHAS